MEEILRELSKRIRKEQYETWFREFKLVGQKEDEIEFSVPSGFVRDWLNRNYLPEIEASVSAALGTQRRIKLSLEEAGTVAVGTEALATGTAASGGGGTDRAEGDLMTPRSPDAISPEVVSRAIQNIEGQGPTRPNGFEGAAVAGAAALPGTNGDLPFNTSYETKLNQNYTFEQFVVGPCNRLVQAAALAIGENPGRAYNPFFIHGSVGLGKTHLLQATCHAIRNKQGTPKVLYLSCEEFTNRFIKSITKGKLEQFRDFHRNVDVLVIDDIQFLAGKEKTQEEFFHTFNALYDDQKQIIISSDRPPLDIPTIEERLVSRFKWGLVADMEMPCFETRVAIVKRKGLCRGVDMPDEVAYYIAERIDTNIRELEGAVIKVLGVATITEREITEALAEEALRGVAVARSNQVTLDEIMNVITAEFCITAREITSKSRVQTVSMPRQIGMFLSRELTENSLEEVGRFFGNRDHTTVLYAVNKIKTRIKKDRMFRDLINSVTVRLQSPGR